MRECRSAPGARPSEPACRVRVRTPRGLGATQAAPRFAPSLADSKRMGLGSVWLTGWSSRPSVPLAGWPFRPIGQRHGLGRTAACVSAVALGRRRGISPRLRRCRGTARTGVQRRPRRLASGRQLYVLRNLACLSSPAGLPEAAGPADGAPSAAGAPSGLAGEGLAACLVRSASAVSTKLS